MVTAVQYLANSIGIDLSKPAEAQNLKGLIPTARVANDRQLGELPPAHYLEAIYDVIVGINGQQGDRFLLSESAVGKLGARDLRQLVAIVRTMQKNPRITPGQNAVLKNIDIAARIYLDLLEKRQDVIKRDPDWLGNRHSLVRGAQGGIFEMTNSMSSDEINRFHRTTGMTMGAVRVPGASSIRNNRTYYKVELGSGSSGTTRIARDIDRNKYVAVKKFHPNLVASTDFGLMTESAKKPQCLSLSRAKKADLNKRSGSVITPYDRSEVASRKSTRLLNITDEFAESIPMSAHDLEVLMAANNDIAVALLKLSDQEIVSFVNATIAGNFSTMHRSTLETFYEFSELGLTSVENLIVKLNDIRGKFEGKKRFGDLSAKAKEMVSSYPQLQTAHPSSFKSEMRNSDRAGSEFLQSNGFKLNDTVHNQRFINTLGKKMLVALTELHEAGFAHRDIKPDNIVLCQDIDGNMTVKLIDIDEIEALDGERKLPLFGTLPFMPPEATQAENDGSIAYEGRKADAYAMGVSLRSILGFSFNEIAIMADEQKTRKLVDLMKSPTARQTLPQSILQPIIKGYEQLLTNAVMNDDVRVQTQAHIKAVMKTVPQAISLKDMSDLMLKENPGKRYTSQDVLNLPFFQDRKNFLSNRRFSETVKQIEGLGIFADKTEAAALSYGRGKADKTLAEMRLAAASSMRQKRGQTVDPQSASPLSPNEHKVVARAESQIKLKRAASLVVQRMGSMFSLKSTIAEKKLRTSKT